MVFPRADQFEDPYQGTWSREGVRWLRDPQRNGGLPLDAVELLSSHTDQQRQQMFISCWTANEHESATMWTLYSQSNERMELRSDSNALDAILERSSLNVGISMVQYLDYDSAVIPFRNGFFPFVHKRLSFAHENELRAVIWAIDNINKPQIQDDATSISTDVAVEELVKSVHVSPTAPRCFVTYLIL